MMLFGSSFPMEYLMFGAIGFLIAWLMALMCFPAVHARAERLLRKRYDDLPISLKEMQAEKDQIRAGFATATRDLEVSIGKLKEKTAFHATDIAKKAQLIDRLKDEIATLDEALTRSTEREREARAELHEIRKEFDLVDTTLAGITERERGVRADLREARRELALKDGALDAAEREISAIKSEIARLGPLLQPIQPIQPIDPVQRPAEIVPLANVAAATAQRQPSPAQVHDDGIMRAWTEIDAAARKVEQRYDGTPPASPLTNQTLRAIYAPVTKPSD